MTAMFDARGLPLPKRLLRSPMSFAVTLGLVARSDVIGCFTRPLAAMVAPLGIRTAELDDAMPRFDLSIIARRDLLPTPAVSQFIACLRRAVNETLG